MICPHGHRLSTNIARSMHTAQHRVAAWLAIFAMLAAALAPAVSRASLPGVGGRFLVDICSAARTGFVVPGPASGTRPGGAIPDPLGDPRPLPHALDGCPYCCFHAGVALPPAPALAWLPAPAGNAPQPRIAFVAPRPRDAWPSCQPRAPPL
jgi:hypothetical protein